MKTLIRHASEVCIALVSAAAVIVAMAAGSAPAAPPPVQTQVHEFDGHRVTLDVYPAAGPLRGAAILSHGFTRSRARAIQPALKMLEKKGITLKFLPPYSPELNRIEKLWWLMKHRWMALARRTKEELEQAVDHILTNFGAEFKMKF